MNYIIYKITNTINGKIYIGKHQTCDLNDGYMGSGKLLKAAIDKYGIEYFEKEILDVFESEAEMNQREAELVTREFVKEDTNYNLCPGGHGGFGYINSAGLNHKGHTKEVYQRVSKALKGVKKGPLSENAKKKIGDASKKNKTYLYAVSGVVGREKTDEHKKKLSDAAKKQVRNDVTCPQCGKAGKGPGIYKHHFKNCRYSSVEER